MTKFERVESSFSKISANISALRTFIHSHWTKLEQVEFDVNEWRGTITLKSGYTEDTKKTPLEIAVLFTREGWKRQKNPHTCGAIDWVNTIDGMVVVIEGAEKAPDLKEEVRMH